MNFKQIFELLKTESDRGCALIAGCLVEDVLALTINCHLIDCGEAFRKKLFEGSDAPLGTFSAKIKMGRALAIYDEKLQTRLGAAKDIRNAFAHALRPLTFDHPAVVTEASKLLYDPLPEAENGLAPARIRYIAFCYTTAMKLFQVANERGGREMSVAMSIVAPPHQARQ